MSDPTKAALVALATLATLVCLICIAILPSSYAGNTPTELTLTPMAYLPLVQRQSTPTISPTPTASPTPTRTPTPTATPTIEPPIGNNVRCRLDLDTQICAWVSAGNPPQNSTVTVYGRLLVNSIGQANQPMATTWHYKTTTADCSGTTGANGIAQCSRDIGRATIGYQVNIDVTINNHTITTWFTPS